jgi:hypothetical protein
LHGRIALDSDDNLSFWQRVNAQAINKLGLELAAANIDSIGRANIAQLGVTLSEFLEELSLEKVESLIASSADSTTTLSKSDQIMLNEISENHALEITKRRIGVETKALLNLGDSGLLTLINDQKFAASSPIFVDFSTNYD